MTSTEIPVPPDVQRAVWAATTEVPGVVPTAMGMDPADVLHLSVRGWSPSLHATTIAVRVAASSDAASVVAALAPLVETQTTRADDALALGIGLPLATGVRPEIDHLGVDASQMLIAIENALDDRACRFADTLADYKDWELDDRHGIELVSRMLGGMSSGIGLSHGNRAGDGGALLQESGCSVMERGGGRAVGGPAATLRIGEERILIGSEDGATRLMMTERDHPRKSVVAAIAGARVDAIASMHPAIDGRRISRAFARRGNLNVMLEPLDVRIGALRGMTADAAIDALHEAVDRRSGETA